MNDVFFRVKRDMKLQRLIDIYYDKDSPNHKTVMFIDPMATTSRLTRCQKGPSSRTKMQSSYFSAK
jgi:hypothetical protein